MSWQTLCKHSSELKSISLGSPSTRHASQPKSTDTLFFPSYQETEVHFPGLLWSEVQLEAALQIPPPHPQNHEQTKTHVSLTTTTTTSCFYCSCSSTKQPISSAGRGGPPLTCSLSLSQESQLKWVRRWVDMGFRELLGNFLGGKNLSVKTTVAPLLGQSSHSCLIMEREFTRPHLMLGQVISFNQDGKSTMEKRWHSGWWGDASCSDERGTEFTHQGAHCPWTPPRYTLLSPLASCRFPHKLLSPSMRGIARPSMAYSLTLNPAPSQPVKPFLPVNGIWIITYFNWKLIRIKQALIQKLASASI